MPNQFFFEEGPFNVANDIEESFATDYWFFEQYIGDQLYAWGENVYGEVGDNTIASRSTPRQEFTSSTNWKQVSTGFQHTAAIKTDGTLWCWGVNASGQLGDNTNASRSTPRQVGTATNWKQVSCGYKFTSAIKTDGTLWTWGYNLFGNLGDNTIAYRSTPRQVGTETNWKQVSAGNYHTAAIKTDGTLWCWGYGGLGGLGNNSNINISTPIQEFTSSTNWKQVACSGSNTNTTYAIKTDGTLWSWGFAGTNGVSNATTVSTPRQVGTSSNWRQVSISGYNIGAIKADGTLWVWGYGNDGQLGLNDNTNRQTPTPIFGGGTNWKQVSVGEYNGQSSTYSAIKTDGTLWSWGNNAYGGLGINATGNRSTPVQEFTSSTNWKQVSSGRHTVAVKTGLDIATGLP